MLLLLPGCSPPEIQEPPKPLRDYRGIIHCHSKYSHDSKGTYEEILEAAKEAKVDFVCMTDHPPGGDKGLPLREGWRGIHDGVLFIQGAEYSDQILGLGLKGPISGKDRRGTIQAIHEQGGVAIACHPEEIDDWDAYAEADGMEIYNVHATLKRLSKDKTFPLRVAKAVKEAPEKSFQVLQELDSAILKKWDELNVQRAADGRGPLKGIAGNDAHQNVNFFGLQLDPYPRAFRFVSTHVVAAELTEEGILGALRRGDCYVVFDISGDPKGASRPAVVEKGFVNGTCLGTKAQAENAMTEAWKGMGRRDMKALQEWAVFRWEYELEGGRPWVVSGVEFRTNILKQ